MVGKLIYNLTIAREIGRNKRGSVNFDGFWEEIGRQVAKEEVAVEWSKRTRQKRHETVTSGETSWERTLEGCEVGDLGV